MKIVYLKPEVKEQLSQILDGWVDVPIFNSNRDIHESISYHTSFLSTDYFEVQDDYVNKDFYSIIKPERFDVYSLHKSHVFTKVHINNLEDQLFEW